MPIIRRQLKPSDVYPDDLRYNEGTDTVQSLVNGEWVDNPDADPRRQTTLPPRMTSDTQCDAAASVSDAFKGQIDSIILAIDNASTAFTIAGLILGLLAFGPFGIFIGIALAVADAMIAAGSSALEAALTPTAYEQLTCILYCHMTASGRLEAGALPEIESEVNSQIGGLAAVTFNSMLELAGEGGINNLASLGTSTGDCSDCGCAGCNEKYLPFGVNHGIVINRTQSYMDVQAQNPGNNVGYVILQATPLNNCCFCVGLGVVGAGSIVARLHMLCGTPYSEANWIGQTPEGKCVQMLQVQTQVGTVIRITFSECA